MLLDTQAEAFNHPHGERHHAPPPPPPPTPIQPRAPLPGPYPEPLKNLIQLLGYTVGHAPVYNPKAPSRLESLAQAVEFVKASLDDHAARCLDDLVTMQRCLHTVYVEVTKPREIRSAEFKADRGGDPPTNPPAHQPHSGSPCASYSSLSHNILIFAI